MGGARQPALAGAVECCPDALWSAIVEPVDLALCLAVDASSSVDYDEFGLMMGGYAAAFRDPGIAAACLAGPRGAIAVAMLQWSGLGEQAVVLSWTRLDGAATIAALADALDATPRIARAGATALGEGLVAALALIAQCPADAARGVVDVSGDGRHNQGRAPAPVRDIGVAAGVTINALAVLSDEPELVAHYRDELIGGPGAFVMETPDYAAFADAIREKLRREIAGGAIA